MVYVLNTMIPFNNNIEKKKKTHTHTRLYRQNTCIYQVLHSATQKMQKKKERENCTHSQERKKKKKNFWTKTFVKG